MLRLLVNDFRLNAVFVFWVFLLFNVELILTAWLGVSGTFLLGGIQSGIAFASAMVVAVFLREEQNKAQIINRSLPISHAKLVNARYLSIAIFVIANVSYGMMYQRVVGSPRPIAFWHFELLLRANASFFMIRDSLLVQALAASTAVCVAVPLIIRYGTFWRILIGYVAAIIGWSRCIPYLLNWSDSAARFFGSPGWTLLAVVFMIATTAASIRLSIWLCDRKDL
jgi:hypothetical protein